MRGWKPKLRETHPPLMYTSNSTFDSWLLVSSKLSLPFSWTLFAPPRWLVPRTISAAQGWRSSRSPTDMATLGGTGHPLRAQYASADAVSRNVWTRVRRASLWFPSCRKLRWQMRETGGYSRIYTLPSRMATSNPRTSSHGFNFSRMATAS